jgi:hypothetical protein
MAKIRNIGPQAVTLLCAGRVVDLDEVVEIPDEVFGQFGWPEELWEVLSAGITNKDEE